MIRLTDYYDCGSNHNCRYAFDSMCANCGNRFGIHSGDHPHPMMGDYEQCQAFKQMMYGPYLPTAEEVYELLRQELEL